MADWKTHLNYNHNPSYHAYAYGLLYPNGFDQRFDGGGAAVTNARADLAGPTPIYQAAAAAAAGKAQGACPPDSPEEQADSGQYLYESSEFYYPGEKTGGQVVFNKQRQAPVDQRPHEARQTGSDTASDCEAYISPGIKPEIKMPLSSV